MHIYIYRHQNKVPGSNSDTKQLVSINVVIVVYASSCPTEHVQSILRRRATWAP